MQFKTISLIPRNQYAVARSLLYTTALTWDEYIAADRPRETGRSLLEIRRREVRLPPDIQAYFSNYADVLHWLVLAADESPDSAAVLPILGRLAALAPRIDLRILLDDDANLERLANELEDEGIGEGLSDADLPLLLIFDEEWNYQEQWGPHPQAIEPLLDDWLADHPDFESLSDDESATGQVSYQNLLEDLNQTMRLWYNSTLTRATTAEVREVLKNLRDGEDDNDSDEGK